MSLINWPTFLSREDQVLPCCSFQATQRAKLLLEVHIKHQSQSLYTKMPGRFVQICWGEVVKLYFHGSCVDIDFGGICYFWSWPYLCEQKTLLGRLASENGVWQTLRYDSVKMLQCSPHETVFERSFPTAGWRTQMLIVVSSRRLDCF